MKLSCTPISMAKSFSAGEMDLQKFIDFCAEQGLEGIDILARKYDWQWKDADADLKQIPAWAEKAGVKIAAYACGNDFTVGDPSEFEANVQQVREALCDAAAIGAPALRIFGGKHPFCGGTLPHHQALENILRGIEQCLPDAERNGVVLALENHGCMPGHSYEIAAILARFNSPWLKCMFDCANFIANNMDEKEDPLTAYIRLKDHVVHMHFKDFAVDPESPGWKVKACPAGSGIVPLRQLGALFHENNYTGYCSLEYEAAATMPEMEGIPLSIKYMQEIIAVNRALARA